jgi:hypothetical protein
MKYTVFLALKVSRKIGSFICYSCNQPISPSRCTMRLSHFWAKSLHMATTDLHTLKNSPNLNSVKIWWFNKLVEQSALPVERDKTHHIHEANKLPVLVCRNRRPAQLTLIKVSWGWRKWEGCQWHRRVVDKDAQKSQNCSTAAIRPAD